MSEEQRTHHTTSVASARLGLFLVPFDDDNRGAMLKRFEPIGGAPGELQTAGVAREGFLLCGVNDGSVEFMQFPRIVALLQECGRPVRLTWRDPAVAEYRDRHQFLRTKLHVGKEAEYLERAAKSMRENDLAWLELLRELGGRRGVGWGQRRLLRDALGKLAFPVNPDVRLNAVSPTHGRIDAGESGGGGDGGGGMVGDGDTAAIGIYRRCWEPGGIGVSSPPGLGVVLPGELPKPAVADKYRETLERLVLRGGVPAAFRPSLWWELSGAHSKCRLHPPQYYTGLSTSKPTAEAEGAIAKDIDRTFPGHPRAETTEFRQALTRVLVAFSVHAAEIGYCQSLNFLAGFLLLLLDEEKAFWCLVVIVDELFPPDYYHEGLLGVNADTRVLAHLVAELMPDVGDAFERAGVTTQIVTVEWFMAAYATTLPTLTALRVWDALFVLGGEVLFRVGAVLFATNKARILSVAASSTTSNVSVRREAAGGGGGSDEGADATSPRVLVQSTGELARGGKGNERGWDTLASLGLGQRDTVADTAAKVLAAGQGGGPGSPTPSPALARGGTVRSPASTFPALFGMLKTLPASAHDPDELMRLAYPAPGRETREGLDWSHVSTARLGKLRQAGRAKAEEELGAYMAKRAGM
jgi:hypothetical protein